MNTQNTFSFNLLKYKPFLGYSLVFVLLLAYSCTKFVGLNQNSDIVYTPSIKTDSVINITNQSAQISFSIIDSGNLPIISKGICWDTTNNPTVLDSVYYSKLNSKSQSIIIQSLNPQTTYYVRSFIENEVGFRYGNQISFTTNATYIPPTVLTRNATNISANYCAITIKVTKTGSLPISKYGIVWASHPQPTFNDSIKITSYNTDSLTKGFFNLMPSQNYYFKSFAINNKDTIFGNEVTVRTLDQNPEISVSEAENITTNSAQIHVFLNMGTVTLLAKGVCWSTNPNPSLNNYFSKDPTTTNENFIANLNNLVAATTYYYRAFFITTTDTIYSQPDQSFTCLQITSLPTTRTLSISMITGNSAQFSGTVVSNGNAPITEMGFCYSKTPTPSPSNGTCVVTNSINGNNFNYTATNLDNQATYYVRAYSKNSVGTSYGSDSSFTTINANLYQNLYSANFTNSPNVSGTAIIQVNGVMQYRVFLTNNFTSTQGPDIHVFLSPTAQPVIGQAIDLGSIKSTSGDQYYTITGSPNFNTFKYVSLHCVPFNHFWGAAKVVP